jgi:hypothetical protein
MAAPTLTAAKYMACKTEAETVGGRPSWAGLTGDWRPVWRMDDDRRHYSSHRQSGVWLSRARCPLGAAAERRPRSRCRPHACPPPSCGTGQCRWRSGRAWPAPGHAASRADCAIANGGSLRCRAAMPALVAEPATACWRARAPGPQTRPCCHREVDRASRRAGLGDGCAAAQGFSSEAGVAGEALWAASGFDGRLARTCRRIEPRGGRQGTARHSSPQAR